MSECMCSYIYVCSKDTCLNISFGLQHQSQRAAFNNPERKSVSCGVSAFMKPKYQMRMNWKDNKGPELAELGG